MQVAASRGRPEVSELIDQHHDWQSQQRLVVVRQYIKLKGGAVAGKTLSLFADDPDLQGWRYGAMLTDLGLPALEVWRLYRGRADCENRIKELKADFGLGCFVLRDFWATEAALGVTMLAYNLMSVSPCGEAPKGASHAVNAAPSGAGSERALG